MTSTNLDSLAVQSTVLPLILPWLDIDPNLQVISLDPTPNGWDTLLKAQGIALRNGIDDDMGDCSVITGFDALDALDEAGVERLAADLLRRLKPGGILVLGGHNPEHPTLGAAGLLPARAADTINRTGFARSRVLIPALTPGDKSLSAALCGMGRRYAIAAQVPAQGKAFDIFSFAFAAAAAHSVPQRLRAAEAHLQTRITDGDSRLEARLVSAETALQAQVNILTSQLQEHATELSRKTAEIEQLSEDLQSLHRKLVRATRRRGMRKLAYDIRKTFKRTADALTSAPQDTPDTPPSAPAQTQADPQSGETVSPPQAGSVPRDPTPLSPRDIGLRARLFGPQNG